MREAEGDVEAEIARLIESAGQRAANRRRKADEEAELRRREEEERWSNIRSAITSIIENSKSYKVIINFPRPDGRGFHSFKS